jgi:hypothetical protein
MTYSEPREVLALLDAALGPLEILGEWPMGEVPPRACRWLIAQEAVLEHRTARRRSATKATRSTSR